MNRNKKGNSILLTSIFACGLLFFITGIAGPLLAEEFHINSEPATVAPAIAAGPTVVAPDGLTNKERGELEKQYRYQVRDKASLLSPFISAQGTGVETDSDTRSLNEQEKLYRYFGIAANLFENEKYDEAIEILRYISEKRPNDDYVKDYLNKAVEKKNSQKKIWQKTLAGDAHSLRDQEITRSLQEGVDYFKQLDFDKAVVKFYDVLSMDPKNEQAKSYLSKLKEHYLKEIRLETIIEKNSTGENSGKVNLLLDKGEEIAGLRPASASKPAQSKEPLKNDAKKISKAAQDMLDQKEIESLVMRKRLDNFMDQAELDITVKEIVARQKEELRRGDTYTLGAGDSIIISVRDHPELSGRAVIRLGGEVLLPLVNDVVTIKGFTVDEATAMITESIKRYVKDPYVSISIEEYKSRVFYVVDEVGCTPYPVTRANLTLRDALFVADWGDKRALGRVIVIKPNKLHPIVRKVDAFHMIYGGNLSENIRIDNGDVIYVPLTVAAKVTKTIADTIQPLAAVRSARDQWLNLKGDVKSWKELPKWREDIDNGYPSVWGIGNTSSSSSSSP